MTKPKGHMPPGALSAPKQYLFFIDQLNRIYCAKSHLHERLPEIHGFAHFAELDQAITHIGAKVEIQINRMDQIYALLKVQSAFDNCEGLIGSIEEAFSAISTISHGPVMRDLSILSYLQNIETIGLASFHGLNLAAPVTAKNKIRQLIKENFNESTDDLALLKKITAKYFK
jgi:ferritin-like metal-binding protein YciE